MAAVPRIVQGWKTKWRSATQSVLEAKCLHQDVSTISSSVEENIMQQYIT